jgi:hypothetical protein
MIVVCYQIKAKYQNQEEVAIAKHKEMHFKSSSKN